MNLVKRVINILLRPKSEWQIIRAEKHITFDLYLRYILPLAAIAPIATAIGWSVVGRPVPVLKTTYQVPVDSAILSSVVMYVLTLWSVFLLSLLINALAPKFSGEKNYIQALKLATYSHTPSWLIGIVALIPSLANLTLLAGCYNLYLLYLGLPILMKASRKKVLGYTLTVMVGATLLFLITKVFSNLLLPSPTIS